VVTRDDYDSDGLGINVEMQSQHEGSIRADATTKKARTEWEQKAADSKATSLPSAPHDVIADQLDGLSSVKQLQQV
jgi:hypothetical protein